MVSLLRRGAVSACRSEAFARFVGLLECLGDRRSNLLRVLTYRRVDFPSARPELYPGTISARPDDFARQMQYLARNYQVVDMADVLSTLRCGEELPPRSVLITFDDAYCDFVTHAWPVLNRHGLPVTLFVPTGFPDRPERAFWWDRLYQAMLHEDVAGHDSDRHLVFRKLLVHLKSLPNEKALAVVERKCRDMNGTAAPHHVLGWSALKRLASDGVTLGAHTQTHPLMNRISLAEARREAVASLDDLRRQIGSATPVFAFPGGAFTLDVARALEADGFQLAFTTCRGVNDLNRTDRMLLRRINVGRNSSVGMLRAQMLPLARFVNAWWPEA